MHTTDAMTTFRALHHADRPLLLANAWDHASAAALVEAGFTAIGTTSLGVAAAYGRTDGIGATEAETVALTRRLGHLPCLLTVDIEGGFGHDPEGVAELVAHLAAAGAVGINIEDGRVDGTLTETAGQQALISAIKQRVPGLFVNARTDTHLIGVADPLREALTRAEAYLAAGADGIFIPGLAQAEDIRSVVAAITAPLNVLFQPNHHTVAQLAALGVRRISMGSLLFRAALHATVNVAKAVASGTPLPEGILGYADIQRLAAEG